MKYTLITFLFILASCSSNPIDPLNPDSDYGGPVSPQCPIGYEPVYSKKIVFASSDKDVNKGQVDEEFKCEPEK